MWRSAHLEQFELKDQSGIRSDVSTCASWAVGKVGRDVSAEEAKELGQICALNALAAISLVADLDQIERVVRVGGFVNCAPGFTAIPGVINGASEFLIKIFGDVNGKHARTAVGVAELPLNAPVEVEVIVQLKN